MVPDFSKNISVCLESSEVVNLPGKNLRSVDGPVNGLILGLSGLGILQEGSGAELVFSVDHILEVIAEPAGDQSVEDHLCHGLLTLRAFSPGLGPDHLGHQLLLCLGQSDFRVVVPLRAADDPLLPIPFRLPGQGRLIDPAAAVAQKDVSRQEPFPQAVLQPPVAVMALVGIVDQDPSFCIHAGQNDEVLGGGKQALPVDAVHQSDDDLALPEGLQGRLPVFTFVKFQAQCLGAQLQAGNVIFCSSAEIIRQFIHGIVISGDGIGHHGQTHHGAAVIPDGAGAIADIGIVLLEV